MSDYIWGAAKPAADEFINPSGVSRTNSEEGARRRCKVLGNGYVVVRAKSPEWHQVPRDGDALMSRLDALFRVALHEAGGPCPSCGGFPGELHRLGLKPGCPIPPNVEADRG